MAKKVCAICGKEIGLMSQVQLGDKNYICKDCEKKTIPYFIPLNSTLDDYRVHVKQCEDGQKLYDAYFKKNRKAIAMCGGHIIYDPGTALVCIYGSRGGLLNATKIYNVLRLADLERYEKATSFHKGMGQSNKEDSNMYIQFRNTVGMYNYVIPADESAIHKAIKELDEALSGKKKGMFGFANKIKTDFKKTQDEAIAMAGIAQGMKGILSGSNNGQVSQNGIMGAAQVGGNLDNLFYAGREEFIEKADAAIHAVLG